MTSRERVRRLLAHQPVDRIPNGLGGCETAGLHVLAYENLKRVFGIDGSKTRMYTFMANAVVEPSVLDAMNGDIIALGSKFCPSRLWGPDSEQDWKEQSFWGRNIQVPISWDFRTGDDRTIWLQDKYQNRRCPPGSIYFAEVVNPYDLEALSSIPRPMPHDYNPPHDIPDETLRSLEEAAKWLYENTDYSICAGELISDLQLKPGGNVSWWVRMIEEPEIVHEFLDRACEAALSQLRLVNQAVGRYADILMIADDMGDNRGVIIGPDLWREVYKPHYKRFFTGWHKITSMKILLHSCGSVSEILSDLLECGVDILNPVQISAKGMEPENLKSQFRDKLIFYGAAYDRVDCPPHTPPEIVCEKVKENINIFRKGGRYIFAGVHNLEGDISEGHLRAIMNAYHDSC